MIDEIKKICAKNLNCEEDNLSVSKFYHGDGNAKQKVLFLVTDNGSASRGGGNQANSSRASLKCLVKIRRDKSDNSRINDEYDSCKKASLLEQKAFYIPKALFISKVGEHTAYGEEVVAGEVVSKGQALSLVGEVIDFQRSLVPYKRAQVADIIKALSVYDFSGDQLFVELNKVLIENKSSSLSCSFSHGDLTFRNILMRSVKDVKDNLRCQLVLIDWEYSSSRPVWGIDFIHYMVRALKISSYREAMEARSKIVAHMPEIDKDFPVLVALDRIFDLLVKNYNDGRAEAVARLLRQ